LIDPGAWVSGWDPLFYTFQGSLELVHTLCGLPWWASVIAFAAAIRVLVFPLLVKQNRLTALTQRIQPEIEAIRLKYMYSPAGGDRKERFAHAAKMSEESRAVMRKHGISPFSAFKFTIPQAFATIGTFFVLRSISADPTVRARLLLPPGILRALALQRALHLTFQG
jgi:membrane protein insertase Oxa1/YidC/SpoIIIJ